MAIVLQTPSINTINSFDPLYEHNINFYYTDNQVYKNRLVITDNLTSEIVYDQITESMKLSTAIPPNTLRGGNQYFAQIQVFDMDGNSSNLSDPVIFYCFSTPIFTFNEIKESDVCKNASLKLSLHYSQKENEQVKNYQFALCSEDKIVLSTSDIYYSSELSSHTFYGLENNRKYYLRAYGETVHGMIIDTGYISINVRYNTIPANVSFVVENLYESGYIKIATNIISIGYELENNNYKFEDGKLVLWDNSLTYNEGFCIFQPNSITVPKGLHAIPLQTARSTASV